MARRDARALRDEVAAAIDKGKYKRALECILELEQLEPRDASWPKRAAEMYRRLGKPREAVTAYQRAVERYAQGGFLVQAIAVCKQILQIDPQHSETLRKLSTMTEQRRTGPTGVAALNVASDAIPELTVSRNTGPIPRVDPSTLVPTDRAVDMLDLERGGRGSGSRPIPADTIPGFDRPPPGHGDFELPPPAPLPGSDDVAELGLPDFAQPELAVGSSGGDPEVIELEPGEPTPLPRRPPPRPAAPGRTGSLAPPPIPARRPTAAPPPIPHAPPRRARTTPPIHMRPGAPIDSVPLADVMPGAEPQRDARGESSGIFVIPLEDVDDNTGPIVVEELTPLPRAAKAFEVPVDAIVTPDTGEELRVPQEELSLDGVAPLSSPAADEADLAAPRALSAAAHRALRATPLLAALEPDALEALIGRLELVHLDPGQVLFREGDPGDTLYIISEGEVAVISEGPRRRELSRLLPGSFFGEVALITEQPRSATIAAVARTELLAIDRDVVRGLLADHPDVIRVILRFVRDRLVEKVIQTSPLFVPFPEADRRPLAARFDFLEVEGGTALVRQGERPDGLYVLLAGAAEVTRHLGEGGAVRTLGALRPGEVFGEMALYGAEPSVATVTTTGKVLALRMPAATFREVIMTHPQVLAYVGDLAEARRREAEGPPEDSGDLVDLKLDLL